MNLLLEVESNDRGLASDVMGSRSLSVGQVAALAPDVSIQYRGSMSRKQLGAPEVTEYVIGFGTGVAASYVAALLFAKFHGRADRISIDRVDVRFDDKGAIERIITEKIRKG